MLNYFNFKKIRDKYLITNDFGRYDFLKADEFEALVRENYSPEGELSRRLEEKYFVYHSSRLAFTEKVIHELQNSKNYLFLGTSLHIFVVTTACNHQCLYCQAQNGRRIPDGRMTEEIARKAVDVALQSPEYHLEFEFQGGEPLLNWEIIRFIVLYTEKRICSEKLRHEVKFNIVSNLTLLTWEMIDFIKEHRISISTSIDGNAEVHNYNRPCRNHLPAYDLVLEQIGNLKNQGIKVGAIETTTRYSLAFSKEIVDAYVTLGFDVIALRNLTPLGCADKNWQKIGYTADEFLAFYRQALQYIIEINKRGYYLKESIASMFLQKILCGEGVNYMELRSPCGAGVGQLAYYYDGRVFTCDEGRMLAEMGDDAFLLGNVRSDDYSSLMDSGTCKMACSSSILEGLPSCLDCVYQPYCGTCPVVTYASEKDLYETSPGGYKCSIYKGILDFIFELLLENDESTVDILRSWVF